MRAQALGGAGPGWRWLAPLAVCSGVAAALANFPVAQLPLAAGLLAAAALAAWRPALSLVLVPAALPVLDLAPWSGRRFVDEFDLLAALLLAVAWARLPPTRRPPGRRAESMALGLMLASLAIGTCLALWPWPGADAVDPGNPLSRLNALRLAKGALWAWGLWLTARRLQARDADVGALFGWGMVLGLAGSVAFILAERMAFSYVLDFGSDYRIAGPFSVMSLGGAYVECYLAAATPFLLARLLPPVSAWRLAGGAVALAGAAYALMVTFSRGGYAAMAIGVLVFFAAALLVRQARWQRLAVAAALASLTGAVAYPVLMGAFAQARLKTTSVDLDVREQHWAESLRILGNDPMRQLFGVGLGRFGEANFWAGPEGERAGGHHLVADGSGGHALRLGAGYAYFVDQIVPVQPGEHYRLSYRERRDGASSGTSVSLCQKWIITSFECTQGAPLATAQPPGTGDGWQTVQLVIVAPQAGPGHLPRPVRLSLNNADPKPLLLDQLSLLSPAGTELVRNGGFEAGMDHWTFTSDHHLAWHAKSMLVGVYVELGLLGVAGTLSMLMVGAWRAGRAAWRGQPDGMALFAALCAFTTVGLIDTLVDAPRFLMLWLLLCLLPSALAAAGDGDSLS